MGIYESVPPVFLEDISPAPKHLEKLLAVRKVLENHPESWFTAAEIAQRVGLPVDHTCVAVRELITELIEVDACPIAGCHAGFCWTQQSGVLLRYDENLEKRQAGIVRRRRAVRAQAFALDPKLEVQ